MAMRLADDDKGLARAAVPRVLVDAIERLAGARSTRDVVETLRTTARTLAGADGIAVVLRDNGKCHYVEEDAIGPLWKGGKFPMETCISGWAMMNSKTAVIPDIFADDRIPHAVYRDRFVKSLVMVPIGRDEPIAALGAYWAKPYLAPREVVETLETLARAAATALENAHLIEALSASLRKTELVREDLRHRLNNALSSVGLFADLVLPKDLAVALKFRLEALSSAHALLDKNLELDTVVSLDALVGAELTPYRDEDDTRVAMSGADVKVSGAQAIALGLALNELAAHSARAGALKSLSGEVGVRWREENRVVTVEWQEVDAQTARKGVADNLSINLVRRILTSQLDGTLRGAVSGGIVTYVMEFPNDTAVAFPTNTTAA